MTQIRRPWSTSVFSAAATGATSDGSGTGVWNRSPEIRRNSQFRSSTTWRALRTPSRRAARTGGSRDQAPTWASARWAKVNDAPMGPRYPGGFRGPSWARFITAARTPAPAPIARRPRSRLSSLNVIPGAEGVPVDEGVPGDDGGAGEDERDAARLARSCCCSENSSVASSMVIWRFLRRPRRYTYLGFDIPGGAPSVGGGGRAPPEVDPYTAVPPASVRS